MSAADEINDALDQAQKLAGKKFKMPPKVESQIKQIVALQSSFAKDVKAMHVVRDTLEKHALKLENTLDAQSNLGKQLNNTVDKETFGLDPKSPDDKKILDTIQKSFDKGLQDFGKEIMT